MTTALAIASPQAAGWLTDDQLKIVRDTYLSGATRQEADVLIEIARTLGLNPLLKQIYFRKQWDSVTRQEKWIHLVSIDGFRSLAEDTGEYDGQSEPVFEEGETYPVKCTVKVYRKGRKKPFVGVAYWGEYVQTTKDKQSGEMRVNSMWEKGRHFMLEKCAEAKALRKAFPRKLSGTYIPEEIRIEEKEVAPSTPPAQGLASIPTKALAPPQQRIADAQLALWDDQQLRDKIMENEAWLEKAKKDDPRKADVADKVTRLTNELLARERNEPKAPPSDDGIPFGLEDR